MSQAEKSKRDPLSGAKRALIGAALATMIGSALPLKNDICSQRTWVADEATQSIAVYFHWFVAPNKGVIAAAVAAILMALLTLALLAESRRAARHARLRANMLLIALCALLISAHGGYRIYQARGLNHEITTIFGAPEAATIDRLKNAPSCQARYDILKPYENNSPKQLNN